jgi:hypothetical protein
LMNGLAVEYNSSKLLLSVCCVVVIKTK